LSDNSVDRGDNAGNDVCRDAQPSAGIFRNGFFLSFRFCHYLVVFLAARCVKVQLLEDREFLDVFAGEIDGNGIAQSGRRVLWESFFVFFFFLHFRFLSLAAR
jgi:hypothetical protein